ncbi:MAG: zinc ribbon domain-containing protein [Leptonema sp. (in: Bacteria)]|nr:zinc ribbon domain-containing protein [Leptonema sp. (in: bacteria)]
MMAFLTVIGIGLALLIFLNGLNATDKTRTKKKAKSTEEPPILDAKKVLKMPAGETRPRICPVCGTLLGPEDYLFAALEPEPKTDRKRQAHIYGCPYCVENGGVNLKRSRELTQIEP